jgi:hypothetical protein
MSEVSETATKTFPNVIERVETFIQRMHNLDLVVQTDRADIQYGIPGEKAESQRSLADHLALQMKYYEENRETPLRFSYARILLIWIDRALTHGAIREGPGLLTKLAKYQEEDSRLKSENERLQADISHLSTDLLQLQGRYDQLEKERQLSTRIRGDSI